MKTNDNNKIEKKSVQFCYFMFIKVTSKEAAALAAKKAANDTLKKLILGQEIQKQQRLAKVLQRTISKDYKKKNCM